MNIAPSARAARLHTPSADWLGGNILLAWYRLSTSCWHSTMKIRQPVFHRARLKYISLTTCSHGSSTGHPTGHSPVPHPRPTIPLKNQMVSGHHGEASPSPPSQATKEEYDKKTKKGTFSGQARPAILPRGRQIDHPPELSIPEEGWDYGDCPVVLEQHPDGWGSRMYPPTCPPDTLRHRSAMGLPGLTSDEEEIVHSGLYANSSIPARG